MLIKLKRYKNRKEAVIALGTAAELMPERRWLLSESLSWEGTFWWVSSDETHEEFEEHQRRVSKLVDEFQELD